MTTSPNATYNVLVHDARCAVQLGNLQRAEQLAREALGYEPEQAPAYNILAIVRMRHGRHGAAMNLLRAALAIDPSYEPALRNLVRFGASPSDGTLDDEHVDA